ncbi:hypothetical protein TELCIR_23275 [Teladorsagia circumcincta]|uniref:Uncharacterized protein n=1 Tax=Teladorsagia circumcincta TaxID=45464 RepID=A0A2G9TBJ6_TELCI|nr:hypothetical protein TELCIR_23275 [Teladorsagia circumcincta]
MPDVPSWKELKSMTDLVPWLMTEITEGRIQVAPVVEKRLKSYDNRANQDGELFEVEDERSLLESCGARMAHFC